MHLTKDKAGKRPKATVKEGFKLKGGSKLGWKNWKGELMGKLIS